MKYLRRRGYGRWRGSQTELLRTLHHARRDLLRRNGWYPDLLHRAIHRTERFVQTGRWNHG